MDKKTRGHKQKKPSLKTAKKVVAKQHKKQKKSNSDTFSLTCKSSAIITPTQGVLVSNYFYTTIPLMHPTLYIGVTQNAEFNLYKNMYDQCRINSVLVRVQPKANTLSQVEAQADATNLVTGDGLVHTVIDRDGMNSANIQLMSRYPSYKKFDQKKPFTRKYSIKWPTGVWLDTANLYEDTSLLKQIGANGGVFLYAENILEDANELINEPFADVHIWYNVVFRGKTQGSLSYDTETGAVTVRSLDTLPSLLEPTPLGNFRGTIKDSIKLPDSEEGEAEAPITDETLAV